MKELSYNAEDSTGSIDDVEKCNTETILFSLQSVSHSYQSISDSKLILKNLMLLQTNE